MNMRSDPLQPHLSVGRPVLTAAPAPHAPSALPDTAPVHYARTLTGGGVQARIVLDGQVYALRITRAGKLILTK